MTQTDLRPTADDPTAPAQGCACADGCSSRGRSVTRRAAIGAGVVGGAALLAACGSSDTATTPSTSSTSSSTPSSTSSSSSSSTSASASETSTSGTSASETSASSSSSAAPTGTEVAKVADVPSGGSLIVANGDQQIALAKNADGTVVAHSAICTHQGCAVKADGASLSCPCHGSTFDAFSGEATKAPATKALEAVTVTVSGDAVYVN